MTDSNQQKDDVLNEIKDFGVITFKDMMSDLGISRATTSRNFDKINSLYPGSVIKLKNMTINGKTYGKGKAIKAISGKTYEKWRQNSHDESEYVELSGGSGPDPFGPDDNIDNLRSKLEAKSKKELIDDIIEMRTNLEKMRYSVIDQLDKELSKF